MGGLGLGTATPKSDVHSSCPGASGKEWWQEMRLARNFIKTLKGVFKAGLEKAGIL